MTSVSGGAPLQQDDGQISSDEDNFDEDGQLPEVLTKAATLMSLWDRHAALAKDRFLVDSKLGQRPATDHIHTQAQQQCHQINGKGVAAHQPTGLWRRQLQKQ